MPDMHNPATLRTMTTTTMDLLRTTVAALMHRTGESQGDLAAGLRLSQSQVSRKQAARSDWTLDDLDKLSAHYGIPPVDLIAGPTRACDALPPARRAAIVGGHQTTISP